MMISSLMCDHFNLLLIKSILINLLNDIFLEAKFFMLKWRPIGKGDFFSNQYCFITMYITITSIHSYSGFNFTPK